ncbi:iron ABC transporter permease, partial [Glaesserella parasuis]|nr:iron ABC transporter permease [Glaesserella parasuis]MDE3967097.1 iron ABC transporter permease [Glaesserella parasuis]MDE3981495.1 iron ABC transporter permease [Glaesserella parasuis]MDE3990314.1 iron ABC transporter permease [Glaesserella parasuis]
MQTFFFRHSLTWVIFAFLGFCFFPVKALQYGLFGATSAEFQQAMGWNDINLTWIWFFPLLLYLYPNKTPSTLRSKCELFGAVGLFLFIFLSAILAKISLGYAVFF